MNTVTSSGRDARVRIRSVRKLFEAYMSPGSVTEKLHFFAAEYDHLDRLNSGGGDSSEGEDIEIMEYALVDAIAMIDRGQIEDGKTIMLIQYAALRGLEALAV